MIFKCNREFPRVIFRIDGREYWWIGWFGYQLGSIEWRRPPAGTQRKLEFPGGDYVVMTVASTIRRGLKIHVTWGVSSCGTLQEHSDRINNLKKLLIKMI